MTRVLLLAVLGLPAIGCGTEPAATPAPEAPPACRDITTLEECEARDDCVAIREITDQGDVLDCSARGR